MPKDPYIREKYTKERTAARRLVAEYLRRQLDEAPVGSPIRPAGVFKAGGGTDHDCGRLSGEGAIIKGEAGPIAQADVPARLQVPLPLHHPQQSLTGRYLDHVGIARS